jgi:N-acetylglucosaminyldiphosphoundecaprenol N-acetyl-beta-D-mannosaminyltransferase
VDRVSVLGISIDNCSMREALDKIETLVDKRQFSYAVTPNVDHILKVRNDPDFREVYEKADLVVTDGVPLLWASRMLGTPLPERINGTDLFERTCELAAQRGYSVYLLGGNPGTARNACKRLSARLPELRIAGWECPPYGFGGDVSENLKVQARIRESGADILFVGLGAPKQEEWIFTYGKGAGVAFAVGVGVSFSFVGGDIRRAPLWMQHGGLEWLWRLLKEPGRLWKRYLVDDVAFFHLLLVASAKALVGRLARSMQPVIPPDQIG